jgi:hypothetical protein
VHKTQERRKMPAYLWDPNHQWPLKWKTFENLL